MNDHEDTESLDINLVLGGRGGGAGDTSSSQDTHVTMLTALVEDFGIPFVTTQLGKGVVDERHPLFMGNAALSAGDFVHRAIEASDLIINVGHVCCLLNFKIRHLIIYSSATVRTGVHILQFVYSQFKVERHPHSSQYPGTVLYCSTVALLYGYATVLHFPE